MVYQNQEHSVNKGDKIQGRPMPKTNSRGKIIFNILPFVLAALVFSGVRLGAVHPELIEHYYSRGLYPVVAAFISKLSGIISFSLWDLFWIVLVIMVFAGIILALCRKIAFSHFILRFMQMIAMLYSVFYMFWGYNYFRPDIETRLGWHRITPGENTFRVILDTLIAGVNKTYIPVTSTDYPLIEQKLEESYRMNSRNLQLTYPNGSRKPKTILVSSYFAKSGVSGYFGPFFNEVHLNEYQLPQDYPFNLAHEKAHQFGLANEAEANLAAFIVCTSSSDRRLNYSGYVNLLLYFLDEARDLPDYHDFMKKLDRKVLEDLVKREDYYDKLRSRRLENIQAAANNAYLKSQRIEKGIKNYDQVVALTINWYTYTGKLPVESAPGYSVIAEKNSK